MLIMSPRAQLVRAVVDAFFNLDPKVWKGDTLEAGFGGSVRHWAYP